MEHLAFKEGKTLELWDFLLECMSETIDELEIFCSEDYRDLLSRLSKTNQHMLEQGVDGAEYEKTDTSEVFDMGAAGIDRNDPSFARKLSK